MRAWPRIFPFALLIFGLFCDSMLTFLVSYWPSAVALQPWSYSLRTLMVFGALGFVWRELTELKCPALDRLQLPIGCFVGVLVFILWINLGPLVRMGDDANSTRVPWPEGEWQKHVWVAIRVFGAVIVVPLVEEVFWRSYLMRRLDSSDFGRLSPDLVSRFALLASSFVFALAHRELLAAFVTGIIYAWLYRRTRNLWTAIAAHATTNLLLAIYVLYTSRYEFW